MASYGLDERFRTTKEYNRLLDPSAYNTVSCKSVQQNKCPFLARSPRIISFGNKIYTHNIYKPHVRERIRNVTSLKSKEPRFPYESFSVKDLENLLCRCGFRSPCECEPEELVDEGIICQAYVRKRLFKGPPPHSAHAGGISSPSRRDYGYEILPDGTARRLLDLVQEECPPFYNASVHRATEHYRGWKWSKWTSQRTPKTLEVRPGPGDYTIERTEKNLNEICAEKFRAERRKNSKQPRYVEIIQRYNLREGRPGPADYYIQQPTGTDLKQLGPKAARFLFSKHETRPSPTTYTIKREFDLPEPFTKPCQAKLPEPACFGFKAPRFKYRAILRPGPADYDAHVKLCKFQKCGTAPFGVSAARFPSSNIDEYYDDDTEFEEEEEKTSCPEYTWQFKSNSIRFPPPRDVFETTVSENKDVDLRRPPRAQYLAPFNSTVGRFQPWQNWMPVHGATETPGPGYYNLTKPKCLPAVHCGPIFRAARFTDNTYHTPAPDEYKVGCGMETILATHNKRLKQNIQKNYKMRWKPAVKEPRLYSYKEREIKILDKAIAQLEIEEKNEESLFRGLTVTDVANHLPEVEKDAGNDKHARKQDSSLKTKLLRTFLYNHPQRILL